MALIAREGAEVKVLLKNVFPNLIEAPSVGKDRGEVAPPESHEKRALSSSTSAFLLASILAGLCLAANLTPTGGHGDTGHPWDLLGETTSPLGPPAA